MMQSRPLWSDSGLLRASILALLAELVETTIAYCEAASGCIDSDTRPIGAGAQQSADYRSSTVGDSSVSLT